MKKIMRMALVDFNMIEPDGTVPAIVAPLGGIALGDPFIARDGEGMRFETTVERVEQDQSTGLAVLVALRLGRRLESAVDFPVD